MPGQHAKQKPVSLATYPTPLGSLVYHQASHYINTKRCSLPLSFRWQPTYACGSGVLDPEGEARGVAQQEGLVSWGVAVPAVEVQGALQCYTKLLGLAYRR